MKDTILKKIAFESLKFHPVIKVIRVMIVVQKPRWVSLHSTLNNWIPRSQWLSSGSSEPWKVVPDKTKQTNRLSYNQDCGIYLTTQSHIYNIFQHKTGKNVKINVWRGIKLTFLQAVLFLYNHKHSIMLYFGVPDQVKNFRLVGWLVCVV